MSNVTGKEENTFSSLTQSFDHIIHSKIFISFWSIESGSFLCGFSLEDESFYCPTKLKFSLTCPTNAFLFQGSIQGVFLVACIVSCCVFFVGLLVVFFVVLCIVLYVVLKMSGMGWMCDGRGSARLDKIELVTPWK